MNFKLLKNNSFIKPVVQVAGYQLILQGVGFIISILLVRVLSKGDYALYTIYLSVQGILLLISDSGLSIGFKAIGGKVWHDNLRMASLIKTASTLKRKVILMALVICIVYSSFILIKQDYSFYQVIMFAIIMIGIIIPEQQISFLSDALLLKNKLAPVQISSIINQTLRLILILGSILIFKESLRVELILIIAVISLWMSYRYLLGKSRDLINSAVKVSLSYKKILTKYLKLNYHNTMFYAFQGQISVFIIGMFGTTSNLANLGALSRFAMIFTILNALVGNILAPAFGRENRKSMLKMIFFKIMLGLVFLSSIILISVYFFSNQLLLILGSRYKNLDFELLLIFVSSLLSFISATIFMLNASKGWIKHTPQWEIPVSIIALISGLLLFDINTLQGVLELSIVSSITLLLLYATNSYSGFNRLKY